MTQIQVDYQKMMDNRRLTDAKIETEKTQQLLNKKNAQLAGTKAYTESAQVAIGMTNAMANTIKAVTGGAESVGKAVALFI